MVLALCGYDTAVINQLFSTLNQGGVLENKKTGEQWGWTEALLGPKGGRDFGEVGHWNSTHLRATAL